MIAGDVLIDALINANILFCVGLALWFAVQGCMRAIGLGAAFGIQLKLLNAVFVAILLAPFLAYGFSAAQGAGVARAVNVNLSDMVVSYYLNGGLQMKASEFEGMILLRDTFTLNLLHREGFVALLVITLFLGGVVVGLGRLGYSVLCLRRIVANAYPWRSIGRLRLRVSDQTLVPFSTRGLRNYYVIVPSHMLGQSKELQVALAHEFQHIRQGDLEWEILLEALKPLFFLNPAYRAWKRKVEHLRELNCDREVLLQGRVDVRAYCETLLSICQKTLRRDRTFVVAVPKVTLVTADRLSLLKRKRSFLEHRIMTALETRAQGPDKLIFALVVVPVLALVLVTTLAIQRPGDWSQDRLTLSTVVNLDRLDEINRMSTFGRVRN